MSLTRGNPVDKEIGTVVISNGSDKLKIEGHKFCYNSDDKKREIECPEISELTEIQYIEYDADGEETGLSVSFSDKYTGNVLYNVYDEKLELIEEKQESLEISGDAGTAFYIEMFVNWGDDNENVTVKYYYKIKIV